MLQKITQFFSKLKKPTSIEPLPIHKEDADLINAADNKAIILDKCMCSNYYNYMIIYERISDGYKAIIYVFSAHPTSINPHIPFRIWYEKFNTTEELNNILHRFFIK